MAQIRVSVNAVTKQEGALILPQPADAYNKYGSQPTEMIRTLQSRQDGAG
jgi:hypothetical protein